MTKLDWSRSGLHQGDAARVQRVADFVEPDNMIVSVVPLTPADIAKMNSAPKKKKRTAAARLAVVERAKRLQAVINAAEAKAVKKDAERLVALKAKAARVGASELERQEALSDRESLNREWRAKLLKPE